MGKESLFKIAGRERVQHDASKEVSDVHGRRRRLAFA
jgi:hypothetical protein